MNLVPLKLSEHRPGNASEQAARGWKDQKKPPPMNSPEYLAYSTHGVFSSYMRGDDTQNIPWGIGAYAVLCVVCLFVPMKSFVFVLTRVLLYFAVSYLLTLSLFSLSFSLSLSLTLALVLALSFLFLFLFRSQSTHTHTRQLQ